MLTATKIAKQATALKFNPKSDPVLSIIAEIATTDHSIRLAQQELAKSHINLEAGDRQGHKQNLIAAGQLILMALALLEE